MANEKRLIDANRAMEIVRDQGIAHPNAYHLTNYATLILREAPTVDAVEVVRCRDCKHAWIHPCGYVYCHRDGRNAYEMTFNLDSFCSYGERRTKDGEDL